MKSGLFTTLFTVLCSLWLVAQTNVTDSIVHQNFQRKFMVHLPPNFSNNTARPLVVSLHGGSGNMMNAQGFSQLNPVADQNNFIAAWPQGYGVATPGFSWADGRNTSADQAGIDDIGFIDKLIDTLISRYNIDTNKIYLCGFSNGGFMVQRMACALPDRFAAMASLGASMDTVLYQNCNPSKPIPMAFFNGTADPAMPYGGGPLQNPQVIPVVPVDTAVQFWVARNQCQTINPVFDFPDTFTTDNSTAQLYTFTNCQCNATVYFYKLINGGHTWPGVYVAQQASVLGNTNRDIQGSVELWNFFSQYTLCNTSVDIITPVDEPSIRIFPNPPNQTLHIQSGNEAIYQTNITNLLGQVVYTTVNSSLIHIENLPRGCYFITLSTDKGTTTQQFIKE